jgi:sulfate permease, SulP family
LSFDLVAGAFAVAVIVLVQGAGVSESAPNPDGAPPSTDRDFLAQGAANLVSGLFRGQPVGGSVGQTALNVAVGARTRWAAIWSGVWMLVILAVFSGVVGLVAMPTLAAILIFAAIASVRPREIMNVLRTGPVSQVAVVVTFLATLFLPVAAAVGVGVALSMLLQLNQEAMDLKVVELVPRADGRFVEHPAPRALTSNQVTALDVYGSLFYAGARTLQAKLPAPAETANPVVVLRLRGRSTFGATFVAVVADYAERLDAVGGRLYLSGLEPEVADVVRRTSKVALSGPVRIFQATDLVGESTQAAYRDAEAWIVTHDRDGGSSSAS